jgi:hypothetical protein
MLNDLQGLEVKGAELPQFHVDITCMAYALACVRRCMENVDGPPALQGLL